MRRSLVTVAVILAVLGFTSSLYGQDPALMKKLQDVQTKVQACGANQACLMDAIKELQEVQKGLADAQTGTSDTTGAAGILRDIARASGGEPWAHLQRQCTDLDKQNPKMYCLPVRAQVTDDVLEQATDRTPSGILPHPGTKYTTLYKAFSHTAEAKGKLLYQKDFAAFQLLAMATPKTTTIQRLVMWEQYYDYVGTNATPVRKRHDHVTSPAKIHWPFALQILYPFTADSPPTRATHNLHVDGTHVLFPPPETADQFGTSLPNENANEPMITPTVMKQFVKDGGFDRTYAWTLKHSGGEVAEQHRLTIKVRIGEECGGDSNVKIAIRTVDGKTKYKFSDGNPGSLDVTLQADVTPASYASEIQWELPDLQGSQRTISPEKAKGPTVTVKYTNLPAHHGDFGKKVVRATVKTQRCTAQAEKELQFFYPRDVKNNPEGSAPNWFYYWKQTPAARPAGQDLNIEYGGLTFDICNKPGVPAIFKPGYGYKTVHVCDLSKLGPEFAEVYPLLDRTKPQKFLGLRTAKGIDTFAVAILHEFTHYLAYHNWREGKTQQQLDAEDTDRDGIPNSVEPSLLFDPALFQTYLADDPTVGKNQVGGDEEWLAYEAMREYVLGTYNTFDWASPGKQW